MLKISMMTGRELRVRIGLRMRDAAGTLCERLYRWRLTRGLAEYLTVRIAKRIAISDIRDITNAPITMEEDAAHIALLLDALANLERVQAGEMSFEEFKQGDEVQWAETDQAWVQLMVRLEELRNMK